MGRWKRQPSPTNPLCKSQLPELIWAQSAATLGLIYSDRIKAGSFQLHARAFNSCSSTENHQNGNEKGGSAVAAGFSLWEGLVQSQISPHYQAVLLHGQFVQLSCTQPGWGCRRGGQGFSWAELSLVPGAGSQGTFLNKPAQPPPAPCSHIPVLGTALTRPRHRDRD